MGTGLEEASRWDVDGAGVFNRIAKVVRFLVPEHRAKIGRETERRAA